MRKAGIFDIQIFDKLGYLLGYLISAACSEAMYQANSPRPLEAAAFDVN